MKKHLFLILCICNILRAGRAQDCLCTAALDFAKGKLEKNYAGYADKVTTATQPDYAAHYAYYRSRADTVRTEKECFYLVREWTRWFRDRHIQLHTPQRGEQFAPLCTLAALDSQTLFLSLPSMELDYRTKLQELLTENQDKLARYPNLIIDCRDNGGGAGSTWQLLKKYLYTQTTVLDGEQYWASEDNAAVLLKGLESGHPSKKYRRYVRKLAATMRSAPGRFVGAMNARRESLPRILPYPQRVVILANGHCASNCERFLLWARQSRKVTVMGQHTAGVVDYGNLVPLHFPCFQWNLVYPIMRSNRVAAGRSLDNVGLPPDIHLEDNDPNWVETAHCWLLEKQTRPQ